VRWLVLVVLLGCRPDPRIAVPASRGVAIGTVTLEWSNVHAVFGEHVLLVDTGAQGELYQLEQGMKQLGVRLRDVKCAVVTHGHADHAGTARALQLKGVRIIAGAADRERNARGAHGAHNPTGLFSRILAWFLPETYKPFTADVLVTDRYDLAPCGVAGEVIAVGGHTGGSVVVIVAGGKVALVGDLFRGGRLAGFVDRTEPMVHFYQDDKARAHEQIRELVRRGVELFVLGHGGPAIRSEVIETFGM
jgi:hydroxyacylglutathione hydrolase